LTPTAQHAVRQATERNAELGIMFRYSPDSPDLTNDQKLVQHPHRSELLLNGRLGSREILNPGRHMERSHGREL
jgi:hypothetical protein